MINEEKIDKTIMLSKLELSFINLKHDNNNQHHLKALCVITDSTHGPCAQSDI